MTGSTDDKEVHVGPVYGVRKWDAAMRGSQVTLHATSMAYVWSPGWNHAHVGPPRFDGERGSGFYSLKLPARLRVVLTGTEIAAIGVVELQGHVAVHSAGYRSEWARPVALGYRGVLGYRQQVAFAAWCQRNDIEYIGRVRSYMPWGVLWRTQRQFRRGKKQRTFVPVPRVPVPRPFRSRASRYEQ